MNLSLLLVGLMLIVGWQILTWLQSCFWPSRPLVTAVEGLGIQVPLLDELPAAFKSRVSRAVTRRRIRIIVAPVIAIAVIASAVASGFVASAVVL